MHFDSAFWVSVGVGAVAGAIAGGLGFAFRRTGRVAGALIAVVAFTVLEAVGQKMIVEPYRERAMSKQVHEELLSLAPFRAIQEADPATYSDIEKDIEKAVREKKPVPAIVTSVRGKIEAVVMPYVARADDASVVEFFAATVDMAAEVQEKDPNLAFAFFFPEPGSPLPKASDKATSRLMDALAGLIRSGADRATDRRVNTEYATSLLRDTVTPLLSTQGPGLRALAAPRAPGVDRPKAVRAAIALYRAILALPARDAATVLRFMTASMKK
jgi:hypothetical protein